MRMLELDSTAGAASAVRGARRVDLAAYTLRPGPLLAALEEAARRGARVTVRLEGTPSGDPDGSFARANARVVADLRSAGIDAALGLRSGAPIHAKALAVDDSLYLDDRNFGAADRVLRDDDPLDVAAVRGAIAGEPGAARPGLALTKRAALEAERELIDAAKPGDRLTVESEAFGCCNAAYSALERAAKRGVAVHLLVCDRELRGNAREGELLERLRGEGALVRATPSTEKFALCGDRAWIGSANATAAIETPDTFDWGATTNDPQIVADLERRARAALAARPTLGQPGSPR